MACLSDIVDTERYPIHADPSSPEYTQLVAHCKARLKAVGSVDLEGFIRKAAIEAMLNELAGLPSYNRLQILSPYGQADSFRGLGEHPATRRKFAQDTHVVAGDQIRTETLLRQVYESALVTQFLQTVLEQPEMWKLADEFQDLNLMLMHDGCSRAWHYDGTEAVITLMPVSYTHLTLPTKRIV
eukprot:TRINITY_DN25772_c0_g1_i1.p1 TRINITY_DN25772_c0_g1~~TRINITY_DN25772_c0_g1_i1.p1  ORF type:complete len:184 (+),score=44.30 TRINITY_DN25772_c0_g1_i1:166-717(+)